MQAYDEGAPLPEYNGSTGEHGWEPQPAAQGAAARVQEHCTTLSEHRTVERLLSAVTLLYSVYCREAGALHAVRRFRR